MMDFEQTVDYIRRSFFPEWDVDHEWTIEQRDEQDLFGAVGSSNTAEKRIRLARNTDELTIMVTLVHEIAHAVTGGVHEEEWLKQMKRSMKKACELGMDALEAALEKEVRMYSQRTARRKNPFPDAF